VGAFASVSMVWTDRFGQKTPEMGFLLTEV
jgi:hypothetical protein